MHAKQLFYIGIQFTQNIAKWLMVKWSVENCLLSNLRKRYRKKSTKQTEPIKLSIWFYICVNHQINCREHIIHSNYIKIPR